MIISVAGFFSSPVIKRQLVPITITRKTPIKGGHNTHELNALVNVIKDDGKTCIKEFTLDKSVKTIHNWRMDIEPGFIIADGEFRYVCTDIRYEEFPRIPTVTAKRIGPVDKTHPRKFFRMHPELCEKLKPVTIESSILTKKGKHRYAKVNFLEISERLTLDGIYKVIQLDKTKSSFQAGGFVFGEGSTFMIGEQKWLCKGVKYPPTPRFPIVTLKKIS